MPNPNQVKGDILALQKKTERDLHKLVGMYEGFLKDIQKRLREEYQATGSMVGLEDFNAFAHMLKRNKVIVANAHTSIARMKDIEGYDIAESEEKLEEKTSKRDITSISHQS